MSEHALIIPTRFEYYVKATDGQHLRTQLAQTPERANQLMAADIVRFDPFQTTTHPECEPDDV